MRLKLEARQARSSAAAPTRSSTGHACIIKDALRSVPNASMLRCPGRSSEQHPAQLQRRCESAHAVRCGLFQVKAWTGEASTPGRPGAHLRRPAASAAAAPAQNRARRAGQQRRLPRPQTGARKPARACLAGERLRCWAPPLRCATYGARRGAAAGARLQPAAAAACSGSRAPAHHAHGISSTAMLKKCSNAQSL